MRDPNSKIRSLPETRAWRETLRKQQKKLVLTNGCFDLLHRGHLEYLYQARKLGDALLVAINSDASIKKLKGPSRPICIQKDRLYALASLEYVDGVVVFEELRVTRIIHMIIPDIYAKGGDYTLETLDKEEKFALQHILCTICFIPFVQGYSSSNIISTIKKPYLKKNICE